MPTYSETATGGARGAGLSLVNSNQTKFASGGAQCAGNGNIFENPERMRGGISCGGSALLIEADALGLIQIFPGIVFRVNLQPIGNNEFVGPATNQRTTGVPVLLNRTTLQEITIPGVNRRLKHGDEFSLEGQLALRTEANHTTGTVLDYTSQPLMVVRRIRAIDQ